MKMNRRSLPIWYAAVLLFALVGVPALVQRAAHAQEAASNPWAPAEVTQPSQLAAMLSSHTGAKPVILQVGFQVLYRSKHIPSSVYAGPASTPDGLQALKQAVGKLPRNADIYIYCGCCPIQKCPNIRPAFQALKAMGFTRLHVLMLPTNFGKDWVAHSYPVAGESAPSH